MFNETFLRIYQRISNKAKVVTALALTNKMIADHLKMDDLSKASKKLEGCQKVLAIPLFMADGSQYQIFKRYCLENGYTVGKPILEDYSKQVADLLNSYYPEKEDRRIILLAHGNEEYDNHEYKQLHKYLRGDFTICLSEGGDDIKQCVSSCKEKELELFCLMFSSGHHFTFEREAFEMICKAYGKAYQANETPLGALEQFAKIIQGE